MSPRLRTHSAAAAASFALLLLALLLASRASAEISATSDDPVFGSPALSFEYISPVPGSKLVSPGNNVVLRTGRAYQPQQLSVLDIQVRGDASGVHSGRLSLSDDDRTIVFEPDLPFTPGERVVVETGKLHGLGLGLLPPTVFDFFVTPTPPATNATLAMEQSASDTPGYFDAVQSNARQFAVDEVLPPLPSALVPIGYPHLQVLGSNHPEPGAIFLTPFSNLLTVQPGNITIIDPDLTPLFFRRLATSSTDFKLQPNGMLTYFANLSPVTPTPQFMELDSSYAVVDSFPAGNGYIADTHDLQILPNGHALLLCYDPEPVRMDSIVPGGRPNAIVTGLIVQELDRAKRVVFQWRSWDHFQITDAASSVVSFTSATIDWVHGNAVCPDLDGNLLVSSRHLSEITKIDRRTGDVIWRFGPHAKNNQFQVVGDSRGFSHQHDVRRLPNGDITLFDNGNDVLPLRSRAVEFRMDEVNHVATEVWEARHTPDVYGSFMGSVQRFADGGTMVCWGGTTSGSSFTELHPDQTSALDVTTGSRNVWNYRALVFPWQTTRFRVEPGTIDFGTIPVGETAIATVTVTNPGPPITINALEFTGGSGFFAVDFPPVTLAAGASAPVRLAFHPLAAGTATGRLYLASVSDVERIALPVPLTGNAVHATGPLVADADALYETRASSPAYRLAARVANPARGLAAVTFTLPRAERARLEIFGPLGRHIATVVDGVASAGEHVALWNPAGAPSGLYFCRLTAGGESVTAKVALIE